MKLDEYGTPCDPKTGWRNECVTLARYKTLEDANARSNPIPPRKLVEGKVEMNPDYDEALFEEVVFFTSVDS